MTSLSAVYSESSSYTIVDIQKVMRRFTADLVMIAQSSAALSEAKARDYAHDIERLAEEGYLKKVDITLLSGNSEVCATQFVPNPSAGSLTMSRPGGVLWPRVANPWLRIILSYTASYDATAKLKMQKWLKVSWVPSYDDTSHSTLSRSGGRTYASNGFGLQRTDFS